jgi:7TMR-DISM extracellular 2
MRHFCLFVVFIANLWTHHSLAAGPDAPDWQAPVVVSQLRQGAPLAIGVRTHVPTDTTVEQIVAQPASQFSLFDPHAVYPLDEQHDLWLHFRLARDPASAQGGWIAALPKAFVNRVELYTRDVQGNWQRQVAGQWVAHTQWPLHGLYPQFALPPTAAGEQDIYIKVQNSLPLHFAIRLWPSDVANRHMQNEFLITGLVLGLMLLMSLITSMFAVAYKDITYAWYALSAVAQRHQVAPDSRSSLPDGIHGSATTVLPLHVYALHDVKNEAPRRLRLDCIERGLHCTTHLYPSGSPAGDIVYTTNAGLYCGATDHCAACVSPT